MRKEFQPNRVRDYFYSEWIVLLAVTISGIIYNVGLLANPWFEGKLTGTLVDILSGKATFQNMLFLVGRYILIIAGVQVARYLKRFYVRRFANNINRKMKKVLYHNLIQKSKSELENEGVGNLITKAISDVDDCAEGMRKFTTEVFDTGVALLCYIGMLFFYDWRLSLITMLFPPVSYFLAEKMKYQVQKTRAEFKKVSGRLSADTLDRVSGAITYRVFGCEENRNRSYEESLKEYEVSARKANVWISALPPLYHVISMIGVVFIFYFGMKNVLGQGWCNWDIAAFTTYLACYGKMAVKSSKAAKLFNAVHKAQVSWKRIKPFMNQEKEGEAIPVMLPDLLRVQNLGVAYQTGKEIFKGLTFEAFPGQIIGVTGPVACGKSTFGKAFLCEFPYMGSIAFGKRELSEMPETARKGVISYLGHDPELLNDSIKNNILMGDEGETADVLAAVCLDEEVDRMNEKEDTLVGSGGVRLSGGQSQRLALARTLKHRKPVMILDDPFSGLDRSTEAAVFENLREMAKDSIVILITHRLYQFPQIDQVIWMNQGETVIGTHAAFMEEIPLYAELYLAQEGGRNHAE